MAELEIVNLAELWKQTFMSSYHLDVLSIRYTQTIL